MSKSESPKKKNKKLIITICISGVAVVAVIIAVLVIIVGANKRHEEAVLKYREAWDNYTSAQYDYGYILGGLMGDLGFSSEEGAEYDANQLDYDELSRECSKKVGIYNEVFDGPYVVEDEKIAEKETDYILKAVEALNKNAETIRSAKEKVSDCREIGEAKKKEIDQAAVAKKAEEQKKADEEAEKKRQQEEAQKAYEKKVLNYDKFNNQIKEGMSLKTVKEIYGGFDEQCKVASQSGGWVIYSCSSESYSSKIWSVSFSFYNGILKSKAQAGLD